MKKLFSLLIVTFMAVGNVLAAEISAEQALQIAQQFAMSPSTRQLARGKALKPVTPTLAHTMKSVVGKDNVYVINLGHDQGFVIVAGESGADANVLGYCDHGSFSYNEAPIQLKGLLDDYSATVDYLRLHPASATRASANEELGTIVIGPLLTTAWDQGAPYNMLCPGGSLAGCYPVAVAQVMNYWKWPKESMGTVSAEGGGREDFSGHVYDWDNMLDYYYENYNETQVNAVAKLIADIGRAFGTTYSPEGSPTNFYHGAFTANFGYNQDYEMGIQEHHADKASDLQGVLKADLNKKRPVLYCGGYGNPHALVVDGYTSNDYYHFNYGWGGLCDGYFKYALCYMYHSNVYLISGIRPYDPAIKEIGDLKYEVFKEAGTAEIVECLKKGEPGDVLDIPATVTDDEGITYKVSSIRQTAFYSKGHFDRMTVGENLETVEPFSFFYTYIDTLILNDKLKEVPDGAFAYTQVKSLVIGKNIKRIGKKAFYMCDLSDVTSKSPAFVVDEEAFAITRPRPGDWYGCITSLGKRAFYAATFSRDDFKEMPYFAKVETIGDEAFLGTTMPSGYFKIPPTLRYISPTALSGAVSVTYTGRDRVAGFEVDENNPYFSGGGAFLYNKNNTSLVLTGGLRSPIGIRILPFAETMVRMEPGSISSRGGRTGWYDDVTIPATVVEMEGAFKYCETLGGLTCLHVVPPVITDSTFNDKIFENSPDIALHVPEGTEDLYREAPGWRRFPSILGDQEYDPALEKTREYYMVVHQHGENLKDVRIPVKEIADLRMDDTSVAGQTSLVVERTNGNMESLTTNIVNVDSITWTSGFVYEDAEVFELNDSTLTAEAQKCTVTLDPTIISSDAQMSIRNSVLTPRIVDDIVRAQTVEVCLLTDTGEVHQLSGTAEIMIPLQKNDDELAMAAYFNEETGEWMPVPFKYDNSLGAAVIKTDHLSVFSAFAVHNDSTSMTRLSVFAEYMIPQARFVNESLKILFDIVSSDEPEQQAIMKFKSDVGLWQSLGIDGGYNLLVGLGLESEFLGQCVDAVGYLGTTATILDVISADIRGDDTGVAANTLKTILGFATGQMASAIGTSIMSASMGMAAFIGVALEKLGTTVHEMKKEQLNRAYGFYYTPEGQGAVGNQSAYLGQAYRSKKDWFDYFYPAFERQMDQDRLFMLIEQAVHRYTERFWEETTDAFTFCMDQVGNRPLFGSSYPYPDEATQKEISDEYYAYLMNYELPTVFQSIKKKLESKAEMEYKKTLQNFADIMNTSVLVRIKDSDCEKDETSKYAGWKVKFTEIPRGIKDEKRWSSTVDNHGNSQIGYLSAFSIIHNQVPCNVTLIDKDDVEQATYDFTIPKAKGKVICDIDLANGGVEIEAPHLKALELTYDPDSVAVHISVKGKQSFGFGSADIESGMETCIRLDGSVQRNVRFQEELERWFKSHDHIKVENSGLVRIGDDVIAQFEGNEARGKVTINTIHFFEEQTKEDVVKKVNKYNFIELYNCLLDGHIEHKIECEFTVTRISEESQDYTISYAGEGTYSMSAEVADQLTNYNFDHVFSGGQTLTTDNVLSRQLLLDGKVGLRYNAKLK